MSWTLRVLRHRAAAQSTLLAAVLAVAIVGATLLGTFSLLLFASEHHARDVALDRAPADQTDVDLTLTFNGQDGAAGLAAGDAWFDELLAGVPDERVRWLSSPMYRLTGTGATRPTDAPLAYLASNPQVDKGMTLDAGRWPDAPKDAQGRIEVTVPQVAAQRYGWSVGDTVDVTSTSTADPVQLVVVGLHHLSGPRTAWYRDLLVGKQHDPHYPVPGSFGFFTTDAWGPFVVDPQTLVGGGGEIARARVVASPQLAAADAGTLGTLRTRLDDASANVAAATQGIVTGTQVSTRLAATIDSTGTALAVTRISVVVVGLMLVVLAVTVLLLAARLLAERRAAEQTLMASRGASGGQLFGFAAWEALGVALVTAAVSPWLAGLLLEVVTRLDVLEAAGLHQPVGRPLALWVTCALASLLLAAVLLAPLLRRRGSAVDDEQRLVRQDRRGGLARSGADVALLVLAALAVWQLQSYRSPVLAGAAGRVDPVLVAAPALLLLAGAVLALRLLPFVAGAGERLAARGRSLVGPLAAWEVARRPARASGAVLLLTLAVAVASFAQSFLGTWRTSQQEQADLQVGTDVRVTRSGGDALSIDGVPDVPGARTVGAVTWRESSLGSSAAADGGARATTTLIGVDTTTTPQLLRGRIDGGWDALTAPLGPTAPATGVRLPGDVAAIRVHVAASVKPSTRATIDLTLVLQSADGTRAPVELPALRTEDGEQDLTVTLPDTARDAQLVAVAGGVSVEDFDPQTLNFGTGGRVDVNLTDLVVFRPGEDVATATPTPVDLTAEWTARGLTADGQGETLLTTKTQDGGLRFAGSVDIGGLLAGGTGVSATTLGSQDVIPALATDTLLRSTGAEIGERVGVDVDGVRLAVELVGEVPYLPSLPRGEGLLVDRDLLSRAALVHGVTDPLLDEWWIQADDADAPAVARAVEHADLGNATARVTVRTESTDGPLRIGLQAALWIVSLAAVALAVAGFAMSATVSVRTRRLELARLQALGAARGHLVRAVLLEHAILAVVAVAAGLALGALLASVVSPLVTVSASGGRPVPGVVVHWPWLAQAALVGGLVALVAVAVAVTTNALLRRASGELLRLGDER